MHIYGATFQEHCFNISRDIVYSVFYHFSYKQYDVITDLICINIRTPLVVTQQRLDYLQNEKKTFLVCDKFDEIGHFRVPLCLCFKASLIAKPFL